MPLPLELYIVISCRQHRFFTHHNRKKKKKITGTHKRYQCKDVTFIHSQRKAIHNKHCTVIEHNDNARLPLTMMPWYYDAL